MSHPVGRHRAPGRYNPATEISRIVSEASTPVAKGAAILAASGGLVASIAVPASAAGDDPVAAPADQTGASAPAAPTAAVTAPATAAAKKTPAASGFGKLDVEPVAKPTGPTPWQLAARAEREERAEREAAERREQEQREAQEAQESQEAAPAEETETSDERTESTSSRSNARESAPTPATSTPSNGGRSDVISIAKQYIGTPYVYGGSTPAGFDCSGFVQYVYNKAGVSLPRVTTAQQAAVTPVSNPQPGDLVFFGSPSWHVGIYVGDGMMIDAPRTGSSVSIRPIFDGVSGYGRP